VGAGVASLNGLAGGDFSWLAQLASLLVLPFAHEDLAIIAGAYFIANEMLPTILVGASLYGGMVASDFALYGLGAGARRVPFLRRYADHRVRRFSDTLKRNVFGLVALCRVVPGIVFVAFVACGWARVSLFRFTVASLVVSALYLPLTLYLVITFGVALDEYLGLWAWPLLLGAMAAASFVRKRVFAFGDGRDAADDVPSAPPVSGHRGMPALAGYSGRVAAAERIPPGLFYLPLVLTWAGLGIRHRSLTLPTTANPYIATGGMWGESKSAYFDDVAIAQRSAIAAYTVIERGRGGAGAQTDCDAALHLLAETGIAFPVVAKPDIGWHGYGVRRLNNRADLFGYLNAFPAGARIVLQHFVPYDGEAAVLYARMPGEAHGRILSLTLRYFPHVVGNGVSTLRELIRADARARWKSNLHLGHDVTHVGARALDAVPARGEVVQLALIGNQRAGGLYRDGHRHVTDALEDRFDAIARSMSEFHYGRFDIRFETVQALRRGEKFEIVEINGIGGEAIDAWDPDLSVLETYRRLFEQQRLLFKIGDRNRARGFTPLPLADFLSYLKLQTELIQLYPASE
jgi:membrane protein DedA with SNARE-associated domain